MARLAAGVVDKRFVGPGPENRFGITDEWNVPKGHLSRPVSSYLKWGMDELKAEVSDRGFSNYMATSRGVKAEYVAMLLASDDRWVQGKKHWWWEASIEDMIAASQMPLTTPPSSHPHRPVSVPLAGVQVEEFAAARACPE